MADTIEAQVIDNDLAKPEGMLALDIDAIKDDIIEMNAGLERAKGLIELYNVSDEVLDGMELRDVKEGMADLNASIKVAEDMRKAFKRHMTEPIERVEAAYREHMAPVMSLRDRYKGAKVRIEDAEKQKRREDLRIAYEEYAPALAGAVPFDRLLEPQWLNKSFGAKKAEEALLSKVDGIAKDWEAFGAMPWTDKEAAELDFFRTLSLRETAMLDEQRKQEKERIEAMKAEVQEYRQQAEEIPEPADYTPEVFEQQETPQIVQEAEQVVAAAIPPEVWLFALEITPEQKAALIAYMKAQGIHGVPIRTRFASYQQAKESVLEVCNG